MDPIISGWSDRKVSTFIKANPEYTSVTTFAEFLLDDDRNSFTAEEMQILSTCTRIRYQLVRKMLESHGLILAKRVLVRRFRTVKSSDNDRWFGPGSSPCHGGSGISENGWGSC